MVCLRILCRVPGLNRKKELMGQLSVSKLISDDSNAQRDIGRRESEFLAKQKDSLIRFALALYIH